MAKVLIGKDEGDMPTWDGGEGKPLLLDKSHRLLWTWLPYGSTGNRVCYSSGREQVVLGTIKAEQRGLVPIPLEADRQAKVESTAPADFLVSPLLSLPEAEAEAKHELSISDYLKREPELSVLRHLSLLASRHYEEFERLGSEGWLASIDWKDIFEVHTHIGRDSTLFQILKETIKTRRLVFLFGGLECGVSVFLSQFARSSSTLTADFKESYFKKVLHILESKDSPLKDFFNVLQAPIYGVFISLAYSAYQEVRASHDTTVEALDRYVSSHAEKSLDAFVVWYLLEISKCNAEQNKNQVEPFLIVLSRMIEAAGHRGALTVLLSFPGLFRWLKHHERAEAMTSILWNELLVFTNRNYDVRTGEPKQHSSLNLIPDNVGILVELQHLPLTDLPQAFCRQSILVLPPFNVTEVRQVWEQRIHLGNGTVVAEQLIQQTGGHPWFLDQYISCVEMLVANKDQNNGKLDNIDILAILTEASRVAVSLLTEQVPSDGQLAKLSERTRQYVKQVDRILSVDTRTDVAFIDDLGRVRRPLKWPTVSPPYARWEEWLESGLLWSAAPSGSSNKLLGFDLFPQLAIRDRGILVARLIERLVAKK